MERSKLQTDLAITLLEHLGAGVFESTSDVRDFLDDVGDLVQDDWEKMQQNQPPTNKGRS